MSCKTFYLTLLCLACALLTLIPRATQAQNLTITRLGDFTAVALPVAAMMPVLVDGDQDEYYDFTDMAWAYGTTMATTYALKWTLNHTRPDGDPYSFPSAHTSSAFSGATLIQLRYGAKYGIPAFILAGFVGYSRVQAERHFWGDVLGGAFIGTGISYLVYKKWSRRLNIYPLASKQSVGFSVNYTL